MSNRGATILSRTIVSSIDFSNSPRRISPIEANRENRGYLMGVQAHEYIRICIYIYILHIRTRTRNSMSFRQRVYMWQSEEHSKRKQVNCIGNFRNETLNRVPQLATGISMVHRSNKMQRYSFSLIFHNRKVFRIRRIYMEIEILQNYRNVANYMIFS